MDKKRIYLSPPHMGNKEFEFVKEAFETNWVVPVGPHVDMFEKEFCKITGARFAAAVSSGSAAIHLALILLGIQRRRLNREGKIPGNTGKGPCPPIISILILVIITG